MTSFIARAVLWLIFAFFVIDVINESKVFSVPVPWYSVMGPVMLLFGLQEAVLKRLEIKRKSSTDPELAQSKWFKIFYVAMWIFVIGLLISIPLVWWGVIKKATTAGNSFNWQTPLPR
ncbi:MAG: hypothetical protein P8185_01800 [Deltaproteobacteria bacterium]|jgi:hypothetical protein